MVNFVSASVRTGDTTNATPYIVIGIIALIVIIAVVVYIVMRSNKSFDEIIGEEDNDVNNIMKEPDGENSVVSAEEPLEDVAEEIAEEEVSDEVSEDVADVSEEESVPPVQGDEIEQIVNAQEDSLAKDAELVEEEILAENIDKEVDLNVTEDRDIIEEIIKTDEETDIK